MGLAKLRTSLGRASRWLLTLGLLSACRQSQAQPGRSEVAKIPATFTVAQKIYDGGLARDWQDWGWGAHELKGGPARINMTQYGGFILHHDKISTAYGALVFRVRAPASFGNFLSVHLGNKQDGTTFPDIEIGPEHVRPGADGFSDVYVPWKLLNPNGDAFDNIMLHARASVGSDWVELDKIALTTIDPNAAAASAANAPVREVKMSLECKAPSHAISPYIYGVAGAGVPWDMRPSAHRWGGNPTTRYNWQQNVLNVGKDWFFENTSAGSYKDFLDDNRAHQAFSALTVPMIGWVAKDASSFGFPVSSLGPQRTTDQHRPGAGDGTRADGSAIRPGPPTQTSVAAPPEMMKKWVETIVQQDAKSGGRSVGMYILDNEPNLWNVTHRDVHPDPLSYDELLDRTIRYGEAIRSADPNGVIAGPAEWGWTGYMYSAKDLAASPALRPDRRAHGDLPLIPWYLKSVREYEQKSGHKILNVLDVHFYPQGQNVYGSAADSRTAALRLRSTRALWDKTYTDESWINDVVRLIPRLKEWVAQYAPGLQISIGEYNFGGEQDMSGALALAEALGRFGTEDVSYAFYWTFPPKGSPAYWAFRAYRDFDGKGGRFLDRSLEARADGGVSFFASRDESGKHVVAIALNLDQTKAAKAKIQLNGCGAVASVQELSYDAQASALAPSAAQPKPDLDVTLAPYSLNVFDIVLK